MLGQRVVRREDPAFLTVGGTYTADVRHPLLDGAGSVHFVRSQVAHGEILSVDTEEARAAEGVLAVVTAADLDVGPVPSLVPTFPPELRHPVLADGRVRYVGQPVAAVVAESPSAGEDAVERVVVDYRELPAVTDVESAADGEVVLFPDLGTNVAATHRVGDEIDGATWGSCAAVVRQRIVHQRLAACPLEVRASAAAWDGDGRLHQWLSTQTPHVVKATLQAVFDLRPEDVHVIAPDVGGGFGPKFGCYAEDLVVAWLARRLRRPVRWVEDRSESMLGLHHGRAQVQHVALGADADGRLRAYELEITQDGGAYAALGVYALQPTMRMAAGVYDIPSVAASGRAVMTTTTPVSAYRGTGRPEATAAIERAVDLLALDLDLDPVELRRRNLIPADRFPFTTGVGTTYDSGDYPRALELLCEAAGYDALRAEQAARRASGSDQHLGIGVSVYVESAGAGPPTDSARIEVREDGTAVVLTGSSPHGQGHATSWAMLAAEQLGLPLDRIEVVAGDTDLVGAGMGTYASRSLQLAGVAVHRAAERLADRARALAADRLEAAVGDVVIDHDSGCFHVAGAPAVALTWADVVTAAGGPMVEDDTFQSAPTYPFGAHLAVVEVDGETGAVDLVRFVAVDDAGTIVNPVVAEGQVHGGLAQGIAQALYEHFQYDDHGNPLTANLSDYTMISAAELPSFELVPMETPTPLNPLGAKGIGESGTIGAGVAVQNAVCDALAHLGVRHVDLPATPERVWQAIRDAATG